MKKPAIDIPIRKAETSRYVPNTSAFSPSITERIICQTGPPPVPEKIIRPSVVPTPTAIGWPAKPKTPLFDRPGSPVKRDTASGGVSLQPREASNENAALYRLAAQVARTNRPTPTTERIEKALIRATLETLADTPRSCDFANVKRRAEQKLVVDASIWGSFEDDFWFNRSKKMIKWTVEQWLIVTNNPLPGNATWLFKHFPTGKSTSAVLQKASAQEWRTEGEPQWQKIFDRAAASAGLID